MQKYNAECDLMLVHSKINIESREIDFYLV